MVSVFQLRRPCPCGSGKSYGDCCAGGPRKRRKKRRRNRPSRSPQQSSAQGDSRFDLNAVNRFIKTFSLAFNEAVTFRKDEFGDYASDVIYEALETLPTGEATAPLYFLLESYYQMRSRDDARYGEERAGPWHQMRQYVTNTVEGAEAIYAKMDQARLGAWRVSTSPAGLRYEPLDGVDDRKGGELGLFCNHEWVEIEAAGVYVGWLLELGGAPGLFFAIRADDHFVSRFKKPLQQSFWGAAGGEFRAVDYEEDVLTLLIDSPCAEAAVDSGRYFLSSYLEGDDTDWYAGDLHYNFVERIYAGRLRLADVQDVHEESYYCAHCGEYHYYKDALDDAWTIEVARALKNEPERLLERLRHVRLDSLPSSLIYRGPFGRHTAEFLLPDERMYELVYLRDDGEVDDDRITEAERFRVEALPLEPAEIRELGLSDDWTISQARAWMREQGDPSVTERLEQAYESFSVSLRWVALMTEYAQKRDEFPDRYPGDVGVEVEDDQWLDGVRELLPSTMEMPLEELDDPGRGTWARIETALREQTEFDRPVLRLSDLPGSLNGLTHLDGVGGGSVQNLREALENFVVEWPMSAGHFPARKLDAADASDDLQSGLDELDELF